jgi:hypothetical protein
MTGRAAVRNPGLRRTSPTRAAGTESCVAANTLDNGAATASPTAEIADPPVVAVAADGKSVVVREPNVTAAVGFHVQVTC